MLFSKWTWFRLRRCGWSFSPNERKDPWASNCEIGIAVECFKPAGGVLPFKEQLRRAYYLSNLEVNQDRKLSKLSNDAALGVLICEWINIWRKRLLEKLLSWQCWILSTIMESSGGPSRNHWNRWFLYLIMDATKKEKESGERLTTWDHPWGSWAREKKDAVGYK